METKRQRDQVIAISQPDESAANVLMEDDPIYSNKIHIGDDAPHLNGGRVVRERVRLINISSRHRQRWELEEIPVNSVTGKYTRLITDKHGNQIVARYDAEILNAEYYWGLHGLHIDGKRGHHAVQIAEPFVEKDGIIYMKKAKDVTPDSYTITLSPPIAHIKKIRLVASEVPNPYKTIGAHNNRIIFHIKRVGDGRPLPFRPDYRSIPFYLIEIPEGDYSLRELVQTIQNLANEALDTYSDCTKHDLSFTVTADRITGIIKIELTSGGSDTGHCGYVFHWRFWSHWSIPEEQSLYRMLGFARPYLKNSDGSDHYASAYDNIWRLGYGQRPCNPGDAMKEMKNESGRLYPKMRPRPFSEINLTPQTYIYLVIDGLNLTNDDLMDTSINGVINNIFAKVQLCSRSRSCDGNVSSNVSGNVGADANGYLYNTAISVNKVYLESPFRFLETLKLRWVDAFGLPVDFGDREHSLTFEIVQYVDYLTETNFDSTRGIHPQ